MSGLPGGLGSASHLQLPGPPGLSGAGSGLPPGMLNYTSVLSSLASQYAPGIKDEGGPSLSKDNASSPRAHSNDLSSSMKNTSSSGRSSTNGKSSKHRPSSNSSNMPKPPKTSTTESDGERSESDLVIDTNIGNPKHTNGSNAGSGLLLPNGIKSEAMENQGGSGMGGDAMSATPPVSAANGGSGGGGGGSSRSRRDRSPMSDRDSSQRSNASSLAIKKERNTPQPNKSMTPTTGSSMGPSHGGSSQMQSGGPLGLPPGLAGRMPPGAAFGYVFLLHHRLHCRCVSSST